MSNTDYYFKETRIVILAILCSSCMTSSPTDHPIIHLNEVPMLHSWSIGVSLGSMTELYARPGCNTSDSMFSIFTKHFDSSRKGYLHALLNLNDLQSIKLTDAALPNLAYFIDKDRYTSFSLVDDTHWEMSYNTCIIESDSNLSGRLETILLELPDHYEPYIYGMVRSTSRGHYIAARSNKYDLRIQEQNSAFFSKEKPLAYFTPNFEFEKWVGDYPPDYPKKGIFGYHIEPEFLAIDEKLVLSFAGSSYVGLGEAAKNEISFFRCSSFYETTYSPMDTADFMSISKAIQFQDTVSRYSRLGFSCATNSVSRIYQWNNPEVHNGDTINASIVVGDCERNKVRKEFVFDRRKRRLNFMTFLETGLLVASVTQSADDEFIITLQLLDIYSE